MGLFDSITDKLGGIGGGSSGGSFLGSILGGGGSSNAFGDDFTWWDPLDIRGSGGQQAALDAAAIQAQSAREGLAELQRQFDIAQGNIAPFMEAGAGALPILSQASSVGGYDKLLSEIMGTGAFGELRDERMRDVSGMLAAGGLSRSGEAMNEAARISPDLATSIAGILTGNAGNLAAMGQNAAVGAGTQSGNFGANAANLIGRSGEALASGILGGQQARSQGQQNAIALGGILAQMFASDPELKTNIEKIGEIGPLNLYKWDWKDQYKETIVSKGPTIGFLSTEVKEIYPEFVGEYGGFDVINYSGLTEELRCHL